MGLQKHLLLHSLKIGNVELDNNIILAPMAGITDLPFRLICKEYGAGAVCTEMVSSKALMYGDEKTKLLLNTKGEKRPIIVQIFGSDIEAMKSAAKIIEPLADIIDINMGCPAPKVVKNGDGSKLLMDLDLATLVAKEVVCSVSKPVTVKIRKGWDDKNIVYEELGKRLENVGVSAITLHGRTREEYFSGECDLECIKRLKEILKIPVIGNGNIKNEKDALKMLEYTKADGIMIARGAIGNPFIFRKIINYLETGKEQEDITKEELLHVMIRHINLEVGEKGEYTGIREMRKHLAYYTKGLKNGSIIRNKVNVTQTKEELINVLTEYFNIHMNI